MRNVLIFAGIASIAAAIALYFVNESNKTALDEVGDAAEDAYDTMNENIGKAESTARRGFNAMS
jgi:hypothetical protein